MSRDSKIIYLVPFVFFVLIVCIHIKPLLELSGYGDSWFFQKSYGLYGIYGQYEIAPYTNHAGWGDFGGTNRGWGVDIAVEKPFIRWEWHKDSLDSNGDWHIGVK